ncbi:MAG: GntR family transcriptional regulator [Acidobacteriota bacterium]|nr:GntR family transcriptional regulator [Acidobacteriota bacterium]
MKPSTPAPLLKQQLAEKLRAAIVRGRLLPGQRVVEGAWAREFGAAQASVREAINLLAANGFLVKSAGRSARVPLYTAEDIVRIYQVRGALEGLAARLAAARRANLAPLEAALEAMSNAAARGDVKRLVEHDLAFHLALAEASANPLLIDMLGRLLRPLFTFVLLRMMETRETTRNWQPDLPRHHQMIHLIRESDPSIAAQFVEHCVGSFASSAHAVWTPKQSPRGRKK